jgi:cell division protein FtsB
MVRFVFANFLLGACCMYFGFHLIWGKMGYAQYEELRSSFELKLEEFTHLRSTRVIVEHKISLLQRNSLDIDALDEYSRKVLGLAKTEELVIPIN